MLDLNARIINGEVYTPDPDTVIKDGIVYVHQPTAYRDQATGNYFVPNADNPSSAPIMLSDVVVNQQGVVWAQAAKYHVEVAADGSQIAYTPDPTAQVNEQGQVFSSTGGQPLVRVPTVQGAHQTGLSEVGASSGMPTQNALP